MTWINEWTGLNTFENVYFIQFFLKPIPMYNEQEDFQNDINDVFKTLKLAVIWLSLFIALFAGLFLFWQLS